MRVRHSREQWAQWIDQQSSSNLSVKEFCKLHSLQVQSFYNWRDRLAAAPSNSQPTQPLFVPVTIQSSSSLEVQMPCGAKLRVPTDAIDNVLQVLHQLGSSS